MSMNCFGCDYDSRTKEGYSFCEYYQETKLYNFADSYCVRCGETRTWIPVTEALPNYGDKCLVVFKFQSNNHIAIGVSYCYVQKEGFWSDCGKDYYVTHWMPLPEPPKDGET